MILTDALRGSPETLFAMTTLPNYSSSLLSVCPITGISFEIPLYANIPADILTEQRFPLASYKNALTIGKLPRDTLLDMPLTMLAGSLLSIYYNLSLLYIEDGTETASSRNILLQSVPIDNLVGILGFWAQLSLYPADMEARNLPQIHIAEKDLVENLPSSISSIIRNHTKICKDIIFPPSTSISAASLDIDVEDAADKLLNLTLSESDRIISRAKSMALVSRKEGRMVLLKEGRKIIKSLPSNLVSAKFKSLLEGLFSGNGDSLDSCDSALKSQVANKLLGMGIMSTKRLAGIITDKAFSSIYSDWDWEDEEIENEENEIEIEEIELSEGNGYNETEETEETRASPEAEEEAKNKIGERENEPKLSPARAALLLRLKN